MPAMLLNEIDTADRNSVIPPVNVVPKISPESRVLTLCNEVFDFAQHINMSLEELAYLPGGERQYRILKNALEQLKRKAMLTQRHIYGGPIDVLV